MRMTKKISRFLIGTVLLVLLLGACTPSSTPTAIAPTAKPEATAVPADTKTLPEIKIDAADYSYTAPETISSGWVRVILTNSGQEPHHVQFLRLNDGVTAQQFEDALKQAEGPALAMTKQVGGVGAVHPGGSAQAVIDLPAGEYVILCLIPSPSDHAAHHSKGMIKSLTVSDSNNQATEPTASLNVELKDFMFEMPDSLPVGQTIIKVTNLGPEAHEFNIMRLEDGKTVDDVKAFLGGAGGPPPFAPVGGMNGLDVGLSGYAELDLTPGNYVAICNIPSPKGNGAPHFMLGMIKQFTVGDMANVIFPTGTFVDAQDKLRGYIFSGDMTWKYFTLGTGTVAATGTYSLDGALWVDAGGGGDNCQPAAYEWSFDGSSLTFTLKGEDGCGARKSSLDGHTFVLQQ